MHAIFERLRDRFEHFAARFRRYRRPLERAQRAIDAGRWRTAALELETAHAAVLRSHPERADLIDAIETARWRTAFHSQDQQLIDVVVGLNRGRAPTARCEPARDLHSAVELADELLAAGKLVGAARLGDALVDLMPESAQRNYLVARLWLAARRRGADRLLKRIDRCGTAAQSALARVKRATTLASRSAEEDVWARARAIMDLVKPWGLPDQARVEYARIMLTSLRSIRRVRALDALNTDLAADSQAAARELVRDYLQNPPAHPGVIELDRIEGAVEYLFPNEPEIQAALTAMRDWLGADTSAEEPGQDTPWGRAAAAFLDNRSFNETRPERGPGRWAVEAMTLARTFDPDRCEALAGELLGSGRVGPGARGTAALATLSPLIPRLLEQMASLPADGRWRQVVRLYVTNVASVGFSFWSLAELAGASGAWEIAAWCLVRAQREAIRGGEPAAESLTGWCGQVIQKAAADLAEGGDAKSARQLLARWKDLTT